MQDRGWGATLSMGGFYRRRGKRMADVVCAGTAIVALSPLLLTTAIAVRWKLGAPLLFVQERGGRDGRVFSLYKFRTLLDLCDESGQSLPDADRLTPFGRRLRALSLDELPSLINILRGDMSVIGPRPFMATYLPRYNAHQARRHEVRPGLSGWAQVNGRNLLDWDSRFELDIWYVDHVSVGLDARILWRTVATVARGRGVSSQGHATMTEFMGDGAITEADEPERRQP